MTSRTPVIAAIVLALSGCATTGRPDAPAQASCWHQDADEREIGYCQAVRYGDTLYVSGTAGRGPMDAAVQSVYRRLDATLKANGLSFADVVKENVYTTDLDAFIAHKDLRRPWYGSNLPAATWVQVQRLYVPSLVLEVEVTARIPESPTHR